MELGPNGGLVYAVEYLETEFQWLVDKLAPLQGYYLLFDCPGLYTRGQLLGTYLAQLMVVSGQVELYTHNAAMKSILARLQVWPFSYAFS